MKEFLKNLFTAAIVIVGLFVFIGSKNAEKSIDECSAYANERRAFPVRELTVSDLRITRDEFAPRITLKARVTNRGGKTIYGFEFLLETNDCPSSGCVIVAHDDFPVNVVVPHGEARDFSETLDGNWVKDGLVSVTPQGELRFRTTILPHTRPEYKRPVGACS